MQDCRIVTISSLLAMGLLLGNAGHTHAEGTDAPPPPKSPNIVFLISDDHAWTDYSFMGHPQIETPNLDRLAARGAYFPRGYVPTALCRPALATLANGLYTFQHGVTGNDPAFTPVPQKAPDGNAKGKGKGKGKAGMAGPPQTPEYRALQAKLIENFGRFPTLPGLLGEKGYVSFQSGKWWEGNPLRFGFTEGMTRGFPQPGGRHGDDGLKIGREGMAPVFDFIDRAAAEKKPFFVWYAPFMPHTPHTPPDRLFQKYKAKGIESDFVARYYAMVEWFDETCGQLLDHVDQKGLTNDTIVVYLADNGWIQKADGPSFDARSKQSPNEGGTRQPIIFSWPGKIKPGSRGEQLCSSIDIVPTLLAAGGSPIPAYLPGMNLLPILESGAPSPRKEVFGETYAHDVADVDDPEASLLYRWIVEGKWKLLLTYDGKVGRYAHLHLREEKRPQLFDLIADPKEDHNIAAEHPDVVARLAKRIQEWNPVTKRQTITEWTDQPGVWK